LKNINDIGDGFPFLSIFITIYVISTFILVKKGNHFIKSFTASTFLMLLLAVLSYPFGLLKQQILLTIIIILSILSAVNVYLMRKY